VLFEAAWAVHHSCHFHDLLHFVKVPCIVWWLKKGRREGKDGQEVKEVKEVKKEKKSRKSRKRRRGGKPIKQYI